MKDLAEKKDEGEGTVYTYTEIWDAEKMYGCLCDDGFTGPDCSIRDCPTGDDPLTGTSADPNGKQYNEKQIVVCKATSGSFTLTFKGSTTAAIPYDSSESELKAFLEDLPTISSDYKDGVSITYSGSLSKACLSGGNQITIEFLQDFGDLPLLVTDIGTLDHYSSTTTASLSATEVVAGTKENEYCSNRGICDTEAGVCTCSTNWDTSNGYGAAGRRGDCGYATVSITSCPGEVTCSGHGVCQGTPTYECSCSRGWTGADCSLMTCPSGKSWFSLPSDDDTAHDTNEECSNMGTCDRTLGQCLCMDGFEGSACERMSCPGEPDCSNNGQCLSMALLAEYSEDNGDAASFTYGDTPNNPLTWDVTKIQGCLCDDGFEGYDCSLMSCPTGDDPLTDSQVDEVQKFVCEEDNQKGTEVLQFTFRQQTTTSLTWDSTASELEEALESLSTISDVTVSSSASTLCTSSGNPFYVTFLTEHGNVPMIQVSTENIESFSSSELIEGTKENLPCSGRGLCDTSLGECTCFSGFGSSDGKGGKGTIEDCGYKEPIILYSAT
jgi:hypothetical protein